MKSKCSHCKRSLNKRKKYELNGSVYCPICFDKVKSNNKGEKVMSECTKTEVKQIIKHECKCSKKAAEKDPSISKKLIEADSFRVEILIEDGKGTVKAQHKFADMEEITSFGFFASEECLKSVFQAFLDSREAKKVFIEKNGKEEEKRNLIFAKNAIEAKLKDLNGGK